MKFPKNLVDNWKLHVFVIFVIMLENADVLAVSRKSSSKSVRTPRKKTSPTYPSPGTGISTRLLSEIRALDNQLLCFPKLLCTIYQDDSIMSRHKSLNATELGVAYLKLLRAVNYRSSTAPTTAPPARKRPIIQIFQIPLGTIQTSYEGRKDHFAHDDDSEDYPYHFRSPLADMDLHYDDYVDNYSPESNSPSGDYYDEDKEHRDYLKEKMEISQMMQEEKDYDQALRDAEDDEPSSRGGLASSFLTSFLPFMGSRSMRSLYYADSTKRRLSLPKDKRKTVQHVITRRRGLRERKFRNQPDAPKDPFWKAVNVWRKLKNRGQCKEMYKSCPFEAWEIMRMLDLVKGQSKVLSTYLKIKVDNVKPSRVKH